jgi:murein DD-endopeptidase MepM/ murein hydrolase activator NlpD
MVTEDTGSFDPRTWALTKAEAAQPAGAAREATSPGTGFGSPRFRMALALGCSALLLVGGAITARLSRQPLAARTAAMRDAEPPALSRFTLVLPNPAALAGALEAAGADPADSQAATQAVLGVIGSDGGEMHIAASFSNRKQLVRIETSFADSSGAVVTRSPAGDFTAARVEASLESEIHVVRGEIDADSFYSSAVAAGVTDTLIPQIAKALAFDFDFQREIHPGDVFEVAAEQMKNRAGQPVGTPKLLFVSLTTQDKSRSIYWYEPAGREGGWFNGNGASVVRALMRTPVDGARVSSSFGMREHPVLGFMKMHKGIDFAAPVGTPIFAAGDAEIEFAGPKGPNGNFVKLRHSNGWETLYLHMDRFGAGIAAGGHVRQGQEIGFVGTTGRSTGPHLHYEVHINDEAVDPTSVKTEQGMVLSGAAHDAFIKERDRIDVSRARQAS